MTEGEIPCERHEAAASDPCFRPAAPALLSALACPLLGLRLLLWLLPGPSPATVPSEGQAWSGAALEGACQPHGCVRLPGGSVVTVRGSGRNSRKPQPQRSASKCSPSAAICPAPPSSWPGGTVHSWAEGALWGRGSRTEPALSTGKTALWYLCTSKGYSWPRPPTCGRKGQRVRREAHTWPAGSVNVSQVGLCRGHRARQPSCYLAS